MVLPIYHTQLKACFRKNYSMFNTDPSQVDRFIKRHLPGNYTDEVSTKQFVMTVL
jgi:hypothetical protein